MTFEFALELKRILCIGIQINIGNIQHWYSHLKLIVFLIETVTTSKGKKNIIGILLYSNIVSIFNMINKESTRRVFHYSALIMQTYSLKFKLTINVSTIDAI